MVKKTLYQELGIPASASIDAVKAGAERALAALDAEESRMSREDYDFRRKLILFARDTLSDPVSRMGYDEKLMSRRAPAASSVRPGGQAPGAAPIPTPNPMPEALASHADALALRAEALALRADAMAIRAGANERPGGFSASAFPSFSSSERHASPLRTLLIGTTILIILVVIFQTYSTYSSRAERARSEKLAIAAAKAEEKLTIQDYYQKYGERLASAEEARRLDRERQQRESEARQAEIERQQAESAAIRQQEADRRYADRVSFDLRRAEEAARREAEREEQRAQEAERRQKREEEMRTERMQARWRAVMQRH